VVRDDVGEARLPFDVLRRGEDDVVVGDDLRHTLLGDVRDRLREEAPRRRDHQFSRPGPGRRVGGLDQ
jgi:hypothetical protein